ncbi:AAA family ATPase [Cetobacterium sp.]|uniref:AAA family ATPase n=1 Tax=Cetobacterium sp. TaxID=2071632 RepID=UPI003F35623B
MIKEINLKNWKSFKELDFKFENINILIGGNASGKTNFLDALELLKLKAIDNNEDEINKIRGGRNFFRTFDSSFSSIEALITKEDIMYEFKLRINQENEIITKVRETLKDRLKGLPEFTDNSKGTLEVLSKSYDQLGIDVVLELLDLDLEKEELPKEIEKTELKDVIEKFSQIKQRRKKSLDQIKHITILDPIPREIRGETKVSKEEFIRKDCSNLISFILNHPEKESLEKKLLKYLKKLLGENTTNVEFVALGENQEFCQLYINEKINGKVQKIHSDIISDGTLRYISIILALLVQPEETILAIEEFDNGIAPSKTKMLLDIIDELSLENNFDVVVTTHNTNLMNYISKKLFEFVFFVYRDSEGYSHIKRIRDINRVSKLMSYGEIGDLMETNSIIDFINKGDHNE